MKHFIISLLFMLVLTTAHSETSPLRMTPVVKAVATTETAVVNISTEKVVSVRGVNPFGDEWINQFFNAQPYRNITRQSLGSGVIIRPDGTILTNEHIILPASKITVTLSDGREFEAELLGASRRFDLALLKINSQDPLPFIAPSTSGDLLTGETVIAIGNPFGLSSSVTTGVISAQHRTITFQDPETRQKHTYYDFIQTDASINPGNSGGPLLNILGELIGINTAIYQDAEGIGFAIPIDKAKRVVANLLEKGQVPKIWLGISVQELTPLLAQNLGLATQDGVLIAEVRPKSPGAQADLRPGDVILSIGRGKVTSPEDYQDRIHDYTPGEEIPLNIFRETKTLSINVPASEFASTNPGDLIWELLGFRISNITPEMQRTRRVMVDQGIVVTEVRPGSPADSVGIAPDDAIIQLDRIKLKQTDQFYSTIKTLSYQDSVTLVIVRRTNAYRVTLSID